MSNAHISSQMNNVITITYAGECFDFQIEDSDTVEFTFSMTKNRLADETTQKYTSRKDLPDTVISCLSEEGYTEVVV